MVLDIHHRTYHRWLGNSEGDQRSGPITEPANKLSPEERCEVIEASICKEYRDLPPSKMVPALADSGTYIASESSFYRILKEEKMLEHRGRAKPRVHSKPEPLTATGPNQVWTWDITYLMTLVKGMFFYGYVFVDLFSRKIVAAEVYEVESSEYASTMIRKACLKEGIRKNELRTHSDRGAPMKGATFLATLQRLGIMPSFSRPRVSDDNAYSEALFRTLKYCPQYPSKPFETLEKAREWMQEFVRWYNNDHLHSGIKFVAPADRHSGKDTAILEHRTLVYEEAKRKHPNRWTGNTRNWEPITEVYLNPLKETKEDDIQRAA